MSWERDLAGHRFFASVTECKVIAPKKGQPKLITIYHDQSQPIPEPLRTIGNRATIRLDRDDLKYRKIPIAAVAKVVWNLPQGR